ncbi:MAG TPA: hypothetical protein DDZ69_12210 [Porphyromonadaceae bacterium]|nr:hypothetical protein [Porphyromonadaceae bacterium]HBC38511.1 hypothetical protein [Porphyromonadaceae bacterium]HBF96607.1 hypothetical protein [Porphyromonadaceae bacterium]HBK95759.1 hypothetical protein [Porphyromonadaceae bacterium]HBQ56561.1 hypothetical protein [Porphyromonadaceae bacterium]
MIKLQRYLFLGRNGKIRKNIFSHAPLLFFFNFSLNVLKISDFVSFHRRFIRYFTSFVGKNTSFHRFCLAGCFTLYVSLCKKKF